jgi:pimeloyl-ACP methyl ester carboxylesterase
LWKEFDALAQKPVLVVRGENSLLLSAATLDEMRKRGPMVETVTVAGQGHAPFLETGNLPEQIASFLERAEKAIR